MAEKLTTEEIAALNEACASAMGWEKREFSGPGWWYEQWVTPEKKTFSTPPDFCEDPKALPLLIDYLHALNHETNGTGIGATWSLTQGQKGALLAGIDPDGQTPYPEYFGRTPGEALVRAIVAYSEQVKKRGAGEDDDY